MPTELDRQRLRMDLGLRPDDIATLPDALADLWLVEAGEFYTDPRSAWAYSRVIAIERLSMQAAPEVDYTQNNTQEKASQRFDHLRSILGDWRKKLADAIAVVDAANRPSAARFGRTTRKPARIKEYPNDESWGPWGWR